MEWTLFAIVGIALGAVLVYVAEIAYGND